MLIKCPECKKRVSDSATSCPHCGYQLEEYIGNLKAVKARIPKKNYTGLIIILVIIGILIAYFYITGEKESSSSSSNSNATNRFLAYNYAEDFVKENLKSPSTAEFPGVIEKDKHITNLGYGEYKIDSWVDSQNSFGATIRTRFSCIITIEADKIRCKDLKFNE